MVCQQAPFLHLLKSQVKDPSLTEGGTHFQTLTLHILKGSQKGTLFQGSSCKAPIDRLSLSRAVPQLSLRVPLTKLPQTDCPCSEPFFSCLSKLPSQSSHRQTVHVQSRSSAVSESSPHKAPIDRLSVSRAVPQLSLKAPLTKLPWTDCPCPEPFLSCLSKLPSQSSHRQTVHVQSRS